jgi:hypothetical protein
MNLLPPSTELNSFLITHRSPCNEQISIADDYVKEWSDQTPRIIHCPPATKSERVRAVQQELIIAYPAYADAMNYALAMVKQERRPRAPGLIVSGPVASGKTTFGRTILYKFQQLPPSSAFEDAPLCAVMISLTGLTTAHGFYGRLLRAINAPVKTRQVRAEREDAAINALAQANCGLLVLDELQDVLEGNINEQRRVLSTIKFIMNTLGIPVLALGIDTAARALEGNTHLKARFIEKKLRTWKYDQGYCDLMYSVGQSIDLKHGANLNDPAIANRILELSGGHIGVIMEIIRNAAVVAIATGVETITLDMLKPISELPDHRVYDLDLGKAS